MLSPNFIEYTILKNSEIAEFRIHRYDYAFCLGGLYRESNRERLIDCFSLQKSTDGPCILEECKEFCTIFFLCERRRDRT